MNQIQIVTQCKSEDLSNSNLSSVEMNQSINTTSAFVASFVFFVRYHERNSYFTDRDNFLKTVSKELSDTQPKRYNHRISLQDLERVSKTQIALKYVYRHQSHYTHVF